MNKTMVSEMLQIKESAAEVAGMKIPQVPVLMFVPTVTAQDFPDHYGKKCKQILPNNMQPTLYI